MKTWSMALAMVLALVLCATNAKAQATAPGMANGRANMVNGTIKSIDGANITVTPRARRGGGGGGGGAAADGSTPPAAPADLVIATDDKTVVMINGEKKAVSDLTVGQRVRITTDADHKLATAITVGRATPPASAPAQ